MTDWGTPGGLSDKSGPGPLWTRIRMISFFREVNVWMALSLAGGCDSLARTVVN
jgi:hypothetical protein